MKLKNNALQELYETIVNGTFTCSPYAASPIDKAFKKCDEELANYKRRLEKEISKLKEHIDMDLEDFKEAYGKWEAEQKKAAEEAKRQHVDYMRSYLKNYCIGKVCFGCPLYNASEPVISCLFSKLTDEEIEKRYRKAVDSEYKKTRVPVSARLPQPWECTIEAKVEINEDILKAVCGIKDDKK